MFNIAPINRILIKITCLSAICNKLPAIPEIAPINLAINKKYNAPIPARKSEPKIAKILFEKNVFLLG